MLTRFIRKDCHIAAVSAEATVALWLAQTWAWFLSFCEVWMLKFTFFLLLSCFYVQPYSASLNWSQSWWTWNKKCRAPRTKGYDSLNNLSWPCCSPAAARHNQITLFRAETAPPADPLPPHSAAFVHYRHELYYSTSNISTTYQF